MVIETGKPIAEVAWDLGIHDGAVHVCRVFDEGRGTFGCGRAPAPLNRQGYRAASAWSPT